jgi:hypothetical protein
MTENVQTKIIQDEELITAYICGKKSAYFFYQGKPVERVDFICKVRCPYDRRTRKGRMWRLGYCHALDEMKGIFYMPPVEIFGGSMHHVDYKKLLKKD